MSLAGDREEIAVALARVDGVKHSSAYRKSYNKGDAFPLLGTIDGDKFEGVVTWAATVVVGQDEHGADLLVDQLAKSLRAELRSVLTLTKFTTAVMLVDGAQVFVVQQLGTRELSD